MKKRRKRLLAGSFLGLLFSCLFAFAAHAEEKRSGKWNFQIAPYAWLAGQEGTVATLPGLPPADIDVDFYDDILGNINLAGMLVAEAHRGRYGMVTDIVYTDIEIEDPAPYGVLYSAVDSQTKSWMVSVAGFYRLAERQNRFLDVIGGFRYWSVDSELTLKAGALPERSVSNKDDWFESINRPERINADWGIQVFPQRCLCNGWVRRGVRFYVGCQCQHRLPVDKRICNHPRLSLSGCRL